MDDLTGDGLGDLLIGRQNYSLEVEAPGLPRLGCGGLTIMVGGSGWKQQAATLDPLDLGAPPKGVRLITFAGPSDYDRLGIWFRTADITGDGIADVLVGADEVDADGAAVSQNQGAAFVIRGGPHLLEAPAVVDLGAFGEPSFPESMKGHVAWLDPPAGSTNYHLGGTVQVADLDGNGRADVLVAATINRAGASLRLPNAPSGTGRASGGSRDGTVYIVWDENFPPGLWPEDYRFEVVSPPLGDFTAIDGDAAAQSFGEEILGGLDYSGDGFPDLMVGDLVADPLGRFNAGRAYVFYNAGNLRGLTIDLDTPPPGVVMSLIDGPVGGAITGDTALHGDFDGDGIADLGIGSPHDSPLGRGDAGSIHVLYGQPGGWPSAIDLMPANLPGEEVMRIAHVLGVSGDAGSDGGDTLCYSAAAGDIDGDGRLDLIVNEMAGNAVAGTEDVGNMLVIAASSLLPPSLPSLVAAPDGPVDFGAVQIASGETQRSVTLTNQSSGPVTISSLMLTGPAADDFEITSNDGPSVLGVSEERTVTIAFAPSGVGRWGAALAVETSVDTQPVSIGLAGWGVDDEFLSPDHGFSVVGKHAVMEIESRLGILYSLTRTPDLQDATPPPLFTVPGTGRTLYLLDRNILDLETSAFYRVRAER